MGYAAPMLRSWGVALVSLALGACGPTVTELDNGSGTGVAQGGEGGAVDGGGGPGGAPNPPSEPRDIEIAVDAAGDGDFEDPYIVIVNDAYGVLKATFDEAELPVLAEVMDGDTVGFLEVAHQRLASFRVTPSVDRVAVSRGIPEGNFDCNVDPMTVTVTFPELANAVVYRLDTDGGAGTLAHEPAERTVHVSSCDGDFDVLAYAEDESRIIGYELIRGIEFVPGGSVSLPLTLSSVERRQLRFQIGPLDGAESLSVSTSWKKGLAIQRGDVEGVWIDHPSGIFDYAANHIDPGPGYGEPWASLIVHFPEQDGLCERSGYLHRGWTDSVIQFDPKRLAAVRQDTDYGLTLTSEGARGDLLSQSWWYGEWHWISLEDPGWTPTATTRPELPEGISWPEGVGEFSGSGHLDWLECDSYAQRVRAPSEPPEPYEGRSWQTDCY